MSAADEQVAQAMEILVNISEDQSVPRNIRRAATKSLEILQDETMDLPVRAINAIDLLEDTTSDPNCPYHARTLIWQAITRLELPGDEDDEDEWYYEDDEEDEESSTKKK